jgi:hypothetical protein
LIDRATAAQRTFEIAPEVYIAEQRVNILKETAKKYLPAAFGSRPTKHAFYCKEEDMARYSNRGYEPVIANGDLVRVHEMVLMSLPLKMHKARERAAQAESRMRLNKGLRAASVVSTKSPGRDTVGGDAVDTTGVVVEHSSVQQQEVAGQQGE